MGRPQYADVQTLLKSQVLNLYVLKFKSNHHFQKHEKWLAMKIVGQIQLYSSHIYRYVMVLHLAEMDVLALIIACSLYVVPIFVFSSQFLYKKNPQEACAYCLLPRNNTVYGHLKLGLASQFIRYMYLVVIKSWPF